MKCKVCGRRMRLKSEDRYEVIKTEELAPFEALTKVPKTTIFEVFDCRKCGCQNIVNTRIKNTQEDKE